MVLTICQCCSATLVSLVALCVGCVLLLWPIGECVSFLDAPEGSCRVALEPHSTGDDRDYCLETAFGPDLETKGYAVIHNLLSASDVEKLVEIHDTMNPSTPGATNFNNQGISSPELAGIDIYAQVPGLHQKIKDHLAKAERTSGIRITDASGAFTRFSWFAVTDHEDPTSLMFSWHQDHEPWWKEQDLYNYLNFYIMLEKPDPLDAGIKVVPWDWLLARSSQMHELTARQGAASFFDVGDGKSMALIDTYDRRYHLDFHFDNVSCTPELRPGDAIVVRGDTIHGTQVHRSRRRSLSIRVWPANPDVSIRRMLSGGAKKFAMMRGASGVYLYQVVRTLLGKWPHEVPKEQHWLISPIQQGFIGGVEVGNWCHKFLVPLRQSIETGLQAIGARSSH